MIRTQRKLLQHCDEYSTLAELYLRRNSPGKALESYHKASEHEQQPRIVDAHLLLEALWKEPSFSYHPDCATAALSNQAQALLHLIAFRDQQRQTQDLEDSVEADDVEVRL